MRLSMMIGMVAGGLILSAGSAVGQATDETKSLEKCQKTAGKETGKYAACLQGGGAPDQDARPVFGYRREFSL